MAKKLTNSMRSEISYWVEVDYLKKHENNIKELTYEIISKINKVLREKYPEKDMVVLRKYGLEKYDSCLKFMETETGKIIGVELFFHLRNNNISESKLVDIPFNRGCRNQDVFPISKDFANEIEEYQKKVDDYMTTKRNKLQKYNNFIIACQTIEELEKIIPLPEELRNRFIVGGALINVTPELLSEIKKDFSKI